MLLYKKLLLMTFGTTLVIFCYYALVAGCYVVGFGASFTWTYNLWLSEATFSGCTEAIVILACVDSFAAYGGKLCRLLCAVE